MIDTERLTLVPLTPEQLALWTDDLPVLETSLHCRYEAEPTEGVFGEIVRGQLEKTNADRDHHLFYTFWLLITKADRIAVGSASLKGPPDSAGEVEIGYGLGKTHEGNGYMTEAVEALCQWALGQDNVSAVIAETDPDNPASNQVLRRCGFSHNHSVESMMWWRLQKE